MQCMQCEQRKGKCVRIDDASIITLLELLTLFEERESRHHRLEDKKGGNNFLSVCFFNAFLVQYIAHTNGVDYVCKCN